MDGGHAPSFTALLSRNHDTYTSLCRLAWLIWTRILEMMLGGNIRSVHRYIDVAWCSQLLQKMKHDFDLMYDLCIFFGVISSTVTDALSTYLNNCWASREMSSVSCKQWSDQISTQPSVQNMSKLFKTIFLGKYLQLRTCLVDLWFLNYSWAATRVSTQPGHRSWTRVGSPSSVSFRWGSP